MDAIVNTEVEDNNKAVEDQQTQDDYNKEARYTSQDIEMERGNTRRAQEQANSVQAAFDGAQSEIDALKQQLEEKSEQKSNLEQMDPDLVDDAVKQNIQTLADENKVLQGQIKELAQKAQDYERGIQRTQEQERHDRSRDEILTSIEAEPGLGSEHRNKAIAMANDLINSGKEQQPQGPIATRDLMSKCYREVAKTTTKTKISVASDTGSAGVGHSEGSGITPGTRESVKAQMLTDTSWKKVET